MNAEPVVVHLVRIAGSWQTVCGAVQGPVSAAPVVACPDCMREARLLWG